MGKNLFEELNLSGKKEKLLTLVKKAKSLNWIDKDEEKRISDKLKNDILTIGVIGTIKTGKSTFLNSFVFEDDVLPAASTPMTSSLSVITYGAEKKIVAEFYSSDEWAELKMQAERSLDDAAGDTLEISKIQAAKELLASSVNVSSLESYLGKTQSDSFENLIEYVGKEGKYVSITKRVTIYYPKEYLKGVEIVDTPGFNDPVVSREERTRAFLSKADVVLLMIYAGCPFNAEDREILFNNVGRCGTGRILIGINKYDVLDFEGGENEDYIKEYVTKKLRETSIEHNDNIMNDILKSTTPIPLSAEMALLSKLTMGKISNSEDYHHAWDRYCGIFGISTQLQMMEFSHLENLSSEIKQVIDKEKGEILFRKPYNSIMAIGNRKLGEIEKDIQKRNFELKSLEQPDEKLEDLKDNIDRANKRLSKKIDSLGGNIDSELNSVVLKGRNRLEDSVESSCKEMDSIIDGLGLLSSSRSIAPQLERVKQRLFTRTLKRDVEDISDAAKNKIKDEVTDFFNGVQEIISKYLPDLEIKDFIKSVENDVKMDIEDKSVFAYPDNSNLGFFEKLVALFDELPKPWIINAFTHTSVQYELHKKVNNLRNTDVTDYLKSVFQRKDEVIEMVKGRFIKELIEPLVTKINDICNNLEKKEIEIQHCKDDLVRLEEEKSEIEEQIEVIKQLKIE